MGFALVRSGSDGFADGGQGSAIQKEETAGVVEDFRLDDSQGHGYGHSLIPKEPQDRSHRLR